jgi:hypothetical protein
MATISKSGITDGGVIDSTHITRIIDALDGTSADIIYATGSFVGSLIGTATTASYVNTLIQNVTISGSFSTSGSRVRNYRTVTLTDADINTGPTEQVQANDDIILFIDNTTNAAANGEASFNITNFLNSPAGRCVELVKVKDGTGAGIRMASITMAGIVTCINNLTYPNGIDICTTVGSSITLMSMGLANTGSAWGNGF